MKDVIQCRGCGGNNLEKFLSLGSCPSSNSFLRKEQLASEETNYPLETSFCTNCSLVQLGVVVPREVMFSDYVYVSSTSRTLSNHLAGLARDIVGRLNLSHSDLAIDIGSNDGALLKGYSICGVDILGIEPSTVSAVAQEQGIETINEFFSVELASEIVSNKGRAKAITATNVFAHIDDWADLLHGIDILLDDSGVFVIEVPYLGDLLEGKLFDTIYHEHLSYLSLTPIVQLFSKYDMKVVDVQRMSFGPSGPIIRVYIHKVKSDIEPSGSVEDMLTFEKEAKLDELETYLEFASRIESVKAKLLGILSNLKSEGKKVVGYGAPAKGNTILNYCQIGPDLLDYLAEKNHLKIGLYSPGMHIPVVSEDQLLSDMPDYALLLAWNLLDEFLEHSEYICNGGKFIVPLPEPRIIDTNNLR